MQASRFKRPSPAFVVAMIALFVALGGTAGAVVTAAVPLAKHALTADKAKVADKAKTALVANNALKLGGQTAAQVAQAGAALAAQTSPSSVATLVTRKTSAATIGAGAAQGYTIACDAGQKVLGGGFASDGPLIVAVASGPTDDATWTVGLLNLDTSAGHNVNLYATCLK